MKQKNHHILCKVRMVCFTLFTSPIANGQVPYEKAIYLDPYQPIEERVKDLLSRMTLEEKVTQMGRTSSAIEQLKVPEFRNRGECLHGVVGYNRTTTVFPQAIGMASAWDSNLIHKVATAISDEARVLAAEVGNRQFLSFFSPNINIARDPRCGRTQEGYGEDPYLVSRIVVAYVKGLQGHDPKYIKVAACPKHFAANNEEWGRHSCSANLDEQILREYYFPHFKAAVTEGNAQLVMAAFNAINGVPCHANKELLTGILRDEWGFNGYVVSDAEGIRDLYSHHRLVSTPEKAAALGVQAGCDIGLMVYEDHLVKAVKEGLVSEETLDKSLERFFTVRFRLGTFDPPEMVPYSKIPSEVVDSKEL